MKKSIFFVLTSLIMLFASGCGTKVNVETRGVSKISGDDAVVNGYISGYEEMPSNVGIFFGASESDMEKIIRDPHPNGMLSGADIDVSYDLAIDGETALEPETTYYYQFFARVNGKDVKGDIKSFTTAASLPEAEVTVALEDIRDLTATNATIFTRLSDYETMPDEVGLYFGKSEDSLKKVARTVDPFSDHEKKSFNLWFNLGNDAGITLSPQTTYYYQIYAKIGDTEKRSETGSFTTAKADEATDAPRTESEKADRTETPE